METRIYRTKVIGEVPEYVSGRISAALELICGSETRRSGRYVPYAPYTIFEIDEESGKKIRELSTTFAVETTQELYDKAVEVLKDWYSRMEKLEFVFDSK